jgi:CheY-like chemotaxis protein
MSTGSDVSILLVEDDECIRLVTTAVLRTIGYTNVSFAGNGEEAVRVCAEKLFDVILMDCEMGWTQRATFAHLVSARRSLLTPPAWSRATSLGVPVPAWTIS